MSSQLKHLQKREALIDTAMEMNACGLNQGRVGNLSVRVEDGFLITPTGIAYNDLQLDDIVHMGADGSWEEGQRRPSSEWHFHCDIMREYVSARAIIHVHSTYATALAATHRGIPAFHYMIAIAGGEDIRCCPYETFGTEALSERVVEALRDRKACLMANHGMVAYANDLPAALALAQEVEHLAKQYCISLQMGGPVLLNPEQMNEALEKFKTYGKQDV